MTRPTDEFNYEYFKQQNKRMVYFLMEIRETVRTAIDLINENGFAMIALQHEVTYPFEELKIVSITQRDYKKYKKIIDLFEELNKKIESAS